MSTRPIHTMRGALAVGVLIAAVAFIVFVLCGGARAAPTCMPWVKLKPLLAEAWGEVPTSAGVVNAQNVFEVFASPGGVSFTVVVVDITGQACVILSGTGWEPGTNPSKPGRQG